jgi:hypothetical protein
VLCRVPLVIVMQSINVINLISSWLSLGSPQSSNNGSETISKVFLYAEIQVAIPFTKIDWPTINVEMKRENGLKSKTWLAGVNAQTVGGFYEFDTVENAKAYATGYLAAAADKLGGTLSVKLFDGDVVEDANRGMNSPYYDKSEALV